MASLAPEPNTKSGCLPIYAVNDDQSADAAGVRWDHLPGSGVVRSWAERVEGLVRGLNRDVAAWDLVGRAIVVEHAYTRIGEGVAYCVAAQTGLSLVCVNPEVPESLEISEEVWNSAGGVLVHLQAGPWQSASEPPGTPDVSTAQGRVRQLLDWVVDRTGVVCLTVVDNLAAMAPALRRVGAFDRAMAMGVPAVLEAGNHFLRLLGTSHAGETLRQNPSRIGSLLSADFGGPESMKLVALRARRFSCEAGRPVEWGDLIHLESVDCIESDGQRDAPTQHMERIAWHEAGHALAAYLKSNRRVVPELVSIVPSHRFMGIVVHDQSGSQSSEFCETHESLCRRTQVDLAGRAAEEIAYGVGGTSSSCVQDLRSCTSMARRAFSEYGFTPDPERDLGYSNLASTCGSTTMSEDAHIEQLVRAFLARQYVAVLETLSEHREMLGRLQSRLLERRVITQSDFESVLL